MTQRLRMELCLVISIPLYLIATGSRRPNTFASLYEHPHTSVTHIHTHNPRAHARVHIHKQYTNKAKNSKET